MKVHRRLRFGVAVAALALSAAACGGGAKSTQGTVTTGGSGKSAGNVNIALNSWVGYRADAVVEKYLLEKKLNYTVKLTQIDEQPAWQALDQGSLDVILENWGHPDLTKTYITGKKTVQDAGPTGNKGIIGWYVPQYVVDAHPDITNYKNLNKYASLFRTAESGSKGQFLGGSPSYVTNDPGMINAFKLNYKVLYTGSEAAEIAQVKKLYAAKKPIIFYFYQPQWLFSEEKLVKINFPPYKAGCDKNPKNITCDYPTYDLNKIVSTKFATSGGKAYQFIKNFTWTNDDQNEVAASLAEKKMGDEAAAKAWVDAHPDKWKAWLPS